VSFLAAPGPRPASVTRSGGDVGGADVYDVTAGGLSLNGTYTARVRATDTSTSLFNCDGGIGPERRSTDQSADVTFGVSVRAQPPVNVRSRLEPGTRTAVVTWGKSPDPDTAGYSVSRKLGSGSFQAMGDVPANTLSWTDSGLPAEAATVTYAVTSSRNGPQPNSTSEASEAVVAAPLDLTAAPPPSTPTTTGPVKSGFQLPGSIGPGRAGTTTRPAPGPSKTKLGVPAARSPQAGLAFPPELVDPRAALLGQGDSGGFQPTLPYEATPEDEVEPGEVLEEGGGQQSFAAGRSRVGEERTPALVYVAAGLLTAVVAAHVLWLRAQVLKPEAGSAQASLPIEEVIPAPSSSPPELIPAVSRRAVLVLRE